MNTFLGNVTRDCLIMMTFLFNDCSAFSFPKCTGAEEEGEGFR